MREVLAKGAVVTEAAGEERKAAGDERGGGEERGSGEEKARWWGRPP